MADRTNLAGSQFRHCFCNGDNYLVGIDRVWFTCRRWVFCKEVVDQFDNPSTFIGM
jgi:hypothetical protein